MRSFASRCGTGAVLALLAATAFAPSAIAAPPDNDAFANAQSIGSLPADVAGTTTEATVQPGEDGYIDDPTYGESVWYRWTAPNDMRVWIDNCDAASDTKVTVYKGSSLGSLAPVQTLQAPGCAGDGFYGGRDEFKAQGGAEYRIQVFSRLYEDGAFHLRMRRILFDGSLSQTASAKRIQPGGTITYRIKMKNVGTVPIDPWIDLSATKPNKIAQAVAGVRYVSLKTSLGSCKRVKFYGVIAGAICKIGKVEPGVSVSVTAKLRATRSLSHSAVLDYNHGGGTSTVRDDNHRNDRGQLATTIVKR